MAFRSNVIFTESCEKIMENLVLNCFKNVFVICNNNSLAFITFGVLDAHMTKPLYAYYKECWGVTEYMYRCDVFKIQNMSNRIQLQLTIK